MNPGHQAYSSSLHSLSYPDPVCEPLHFVSIYSPSLSLHLTSLLSTYFSSLIFTFLVLFLNVCVLMGEVPIVPSDSWFHSAMVLFTKKSSDVCSYHPCSYFLEMIDTSQVVCRLQPIPYIFPRPFTVIRFIESSFTSFFFWRATWPPRLFLFWKKYSHTYKNVLCFFLFFK
jgi:hypothetical protein